MEAGGRLLLGVWGVEPPSEYPITIIRFLRENDATTADSAYFASQKCFQENRSNYANCYLINLLSRVTILSSSPYLLVSQQNANVISNIAGGRGTDGYFLP